MEKPDVKALAQEMIAAVRGFVSRAEAALSVRIDELKVRLDSLPQPKDGKDGVPGIDGKDGEPGIDGKDGTNGKDGIDGSAGKDGINGKDGEPGSNGIDGSAGKDGINGKDGEPGSNGIDGAAGKDGERGLKGEAGSNGIDGAAGKDGINGKDGIDGAAGKDGIDGKDGEPGINGKDGERGLKGEAGKDGIDGAAGKDGINGKDGERGLKGEAGEQGRDAAQLDILPSIDEARSYRRGTLASHCGGLISATRQTDPVREGDLAGAGWLTVVEGLRAAVVTQGSDPRQLEVGLMLTSGIKLVTKLRVPVLVWKDVWREGKYEQGDVATMSGSMWHCQRTTTDRPGTSDAWKMCVKEGARGKDAGAPVRSTDKKVVKL